MGRWVGAWHATSFAVRRLRPAQSLDYRDETQQPSNPKAGNRRVIA